MHEFRFVASEVMELSLRALCEVVGLTPNYRMLSESAECRAKTSAQCRDVKSVIHISGNLHS